MSGPPYPRYIPGTAPGSNAIGSFVIGVSPIGDIPPFDYWLTVISQYANSPILTQLITNMFQYVDQTQDMDAFYDMMFNVMTAQGYGLDVWGKIVGVTRVVPITVTDIFLGFEEAGTVNAAGFNQAPFFTGVALTGNFYLADGPFRTLILAKALANISDGSIKAFNQMLLSLFPSRGNCYVTDGGDMTMTYTFVFALSAVELAIVENSGVLPKPVGVSVSVIAP